MNPLPHPIRVVIQGTSLSVAAPERTAERGEYTFPRWIQNGLLDRGVPSEVLNFGVIGHPTRFAFREWESQVQANAPDVVIFNYPHYETVHLFLPHWLERHVNDLSWRNGPVRSWYRNYLLRPFWLGLAHTQKAVDKVVQARLFSRKLARAMADYELLITRTRRLVPGDPLVFVFILLPPGGKFPIWFPGQGARVVEANAAIHAMLERMDDPMVRPVPLAELAALLPDGEDPTPDGLHFTPGLRRLVGDWMARQIHDELVRSDEFILSDSAALTVSE